MKIPILISIIATSLIATGALLQEPEEPKISANLISKAIAPNATVKANVVVEFAYELHGYANPPMREYEIPVVVKSNPPVPKFKVLYPKGAEIDFLGAKALVYEGTVTFPVSFQAPAKPGTYSVSMEVSYQQCNKSSCFPPKKIVVKIPYKVVKPTPKVKS